MNVAAAIGQMAEDLETIEQVPSSKTHSVLFSCNDFVLLEDI